MPKILFIVDGYPTKRNYANIFIKNQATAIKAAGYDVAVLIIDIRSIRRIRRFGFYKESSCVIPVYRVSFPWGPFFHNTKQKIVNFLACWAYNKVQADFGCPDILHAHFGEMGIAGAKIKNKYNVPLVITEHGSYMLLGNTNVQRKLNVINEAYKQCDSLIAVGTNLAKIIRAFGFEKVSVIPNFIPPIFYNYSRKVNEKKKKQFISVGNLLPNKRFDLTISAFSRICKVVKDISLVIVGTGPLYKDLQRLVHEKKIEDKVFFHGFIPNEKLPEFYKNSSCFVLLSEYETFGVAYAEALACGIPVIATKCGGPEDIVNSHNGLLIPINSEDAAVEAMLYMYHNSNQYKPDLLMEDTKNRFGEEFFINNISEVYSQVMSKYQTSKI